jgi:hypothetical protein
MQPLCLLTEGNVVAMSLEAALRLMSRASVAEEVEDL